MNRNRVIGLVLLVLAVILGFLLFIWVVGHGKIEISLPSGTKNITIKSGKLVESITTTDTTFTKYLPSDKYLITVKMDSKPESFVGNSTIGKLLKVSKLDAKVKPEISRDFVGDNPLTCSEILQNTLITYSCNGPLVGMVMHIPATNSTPTYTKSVKLTVDSKQFEEIEPTDIGVIESVINNGSELLVLTYKNDSGLGFHNIYSIKIVNNSFSISFVRRLDNLNNNTVYSTTNKNGVLLLTNEDFSSIYAGKSFDDLREVNVEIEQKKEMTISHLDIKDNDMVVGYSEEILKDNEVASENQNSIIEVTNNDKTVSNKYPNDITKLEFCGNYICALTVLDKLHIYSLNLEEYAVFSDVLDFNQTTESIYVATESELIVLNKSDLYGFVGLEYENNSFSNLSINNLGVIIALNYSDRSRALLLNDKSNDYPDKQLGPLLNETPDYINSVSVYKNKVFISPELGERVYIPETGKYDYPQEKKDSTELKINEFINSVGIDKAFYSIKINGV